MTGALIALGMASGWGEDDEAGARLRREFSPEELEALLNLAERLRASEQDAELDKLKRAAAREKQEEMEGLPARLSKLEKQVEASKQTWDASKMLSFSSPDGNFSAKVGGRIYLIYRHIWDRQDGVGSTPSNPSGAPDTFGIDTARLQVDGTFFKDFFYRVEGEAQTTSTSGAFRLKDTYLGWNAVESYLQFQAGQMKTPCSQEETCSSRFIDFGERSLLNRLMPAHDIGAMARGSFLEKIFEWNLGVFNGAVSRDAGRNAVDNNEEKDLAGRVFVSPFRTTGIKALEQLRLGFDFTAGDRDQTALGGGITTGDLGGTVVNPFLGTAPQADGLQERYVVNASWAWGPISLRGEYAVIQTDLNQQAAGTAVAGRKGDFDIHSWYVQATWLLTGEAKVIENRIKPNRNLNLLEGNFGAFELAARYCYLDTRDGEDAGVVGALANQETRQITVGLNWWWTSNMVLRIDWEHLMFDENIVADNGKDPFADRQDILYVRWQIDF
jgi:phosphate-selective porin